MTEFSTRVYDVVRLIPVGHVATYGQIAAMLGSPRAARMVGAALRHLPEGTDVPWHRVLNGEGRISIENMDHPAEEQANLLMAEGVIVTVKDGIFSVNLGSFLWKPRNSDT